MHATIFSTSGKFRPVSILHSYSSHPFLCALDMPHGIDNILASTCTCKHKSAVKAHSLEFGFLFPDHEEDAGGNSLRLSTDSQGFVAVVEEEGVVSEDSRGSSNVDDPWKRVGELPKDLAEKLLELKNER